MVDKKVAKVVRIEYELEDNRERIWTAYIMAYTQDEAVEYLAKFLKRTIKVTAIGLEAIRVDAMTDSVREAIVGKKKSKKQPKIDDKLSEDEDLKAIKEAREKALMDLKAQDVVVEEEPVEEKKSVKKSSVKKSLNITRK